MLLQQARAMFGYHLPPFIPRPGFVVRAASFDAQGSAHRRSRERRICSMSATKGEFLWSVKGDEYGTNSVMLQLPLKREPPMADDPNKRGPADRSRISLLEPHEVQYWADKFGVSKERLSEAVRKVGHSAEAVSRELTGSP